MCHKHDTGFPLCCLYEIAERVVLQNHPAAINLKQPYVFIYPVLFSFSLRCSCVHWDKILPTKIITQEIFVFALFGHALFECVSVCVCPYIYSILNIKILILAEKWGNFAGPYNFRGL